MAFVLAYKRHTDYIVVFFAIGNKTLIIINLCMDMVAIIIRDHPYYVFTILSLLVLTDLYARSSSRIR